MFESSSKNRKSWNGRKMVWHEFQILGATDENDLEVAI